MTEKILKCTICKGIIEADLVELYVKDKDGNILLSKKGLMKFKNYHRECIEEKNSRELLFDYVNDKFFYKNSPKQMWNYLNSIRNAGEKFNNKRLLKQGYNFSTIYKCFISIESQ